MNILWALYPIHEVEDQVDIVLRKLVRGGRDGVCHEEPVEHTAATPLDTRRKAHRNAQRY